MKNPGPLVEIAKEREELNKYFSIRDYIGNYEGEIYYFYPNKVENDLEQNRKIGDWNIKRFGFLSDKHGVTMKPICFPYILSMSEEGLNSLYLEYKNKSIEENHFFKRMVPWKDRIRYYLKRFIEKLLKQN